MFQALASKTPHIPYRNSKLTHLLQVRPAIHSCSSVLKSKQLLRYPALGCHWLCLSSEQYPVPIANTVPKSAWLLRPPLLQPCLGGSGKTLMFVNVNPDPESAQETLCSLRFAAKVNSCETAARGGAARNVSSLEQVGPRSHPLRRVCLLSG